MFNILKKFNQISYYTCILLFLISSQAFSSNEYFRSIASGNWNSTATWQMSTNGGGTWFAATGTPYDTSGVITIQSPNTVTVTVSVRADQLTVNSGGILSINAGIILTVSDGSGDDLYLASGGSISGTGTLQTQGAGILLDVRGTFNAALKINSGTTYCYNVTVAAAVYNGTFTVDVNAVFAVVNSGYTVQVNGNITNNGIISSSGGGAFVIRSASVINNDTIRGSNVYFDSVTSLSGSGAYTSSNIFVRSTGNVSLANNVTFSPTSSFQINGGGIFNPNTKTFTFNSGTFYILNSGTVFNSGIFQTLGNVSMIIKNGSNFNAPCVIGTGTVTSYDDGSPNIANYKGSMTLNAGGVLTTPGGGYSNRVYGNLINNGTISGNRFIMRGSSFTNNSLIAPVNLDFDSATSLSGTGTYSSSVISINSTGNVSLANNLAFSPTSYFQITGGGVLNPNTRTFTFNSGTFYLFNNGTVTNSGIFQTQLNVSIVLRNGSLFNAPMKVNSGITTSFNDNGPNISNYFGTMTVDAGAVFTTPGGGYTNRAYGNVTNNGTIGGNSFTMRGDLFTNNGTVNPVNFSFDTTVSLSGTGVWVAPNIYITGSGILNLANTLTFGATGVVSFRILPSGILNPNSFDAVFDGTVSGVNVEIYNGASTSNSGRIMSKGNTSFNLKTGCNFNSPFIITTGSSTIFNSDSPNESIFNRTVTIDTGAVFTTPGGGYTCTVNDTVTVKGTLTGPNSFRLMSPAMINNGTVSFQNFYFASVINSPTSFHTLQGTGSFTTSNCQISEGASVKLLSDHQFSYLTLNAGSILDLNSKSLKLNGSGTALSVSGTVLTAGSTVEYNGTAVQFFPQANISYENVKFNDTAGIVMVDNVSVTGLIQVIKGDVNLNGKIFTLLVNATLSETPGNTFTGTSGFLVTTRNLNAPNSLNVGGLGAYITTTSNLGLTEVKRGHSVQTLPTGNQAIRRYYAIKPFNNSDLNATFVMSYDTTELNGLEESKLSLFKSTNAGVTYSSNGGTVNTVLHQVTQNNISSLARFTAGSTLGISLIMEAFYNIPTNNLNMRDTVRAYLRNTFPPYSLIDSSKAILDSLTFRAAFQFTHAVTGTYYLQLKHRNSLETWSKNGVGYIQDSILNYDFTFAASQAYGNNEKLKGTKYCLYSGDVNQDGFIDLSDVLQVYNASSNFATGYVVTDVNGNSIVDLTDILITFNNANLFVVRKSPLNP